MYYNVHRNRNCNPLIVVIIPLKLEVAPPPKCLSGVGDWIPLAVLIIHFCIVP